MTHGANSLKTGSPIIRLTRFLNVVNGRDYPIVGYDYPLHVPKGPNSYTIDGESYNSLQYTTQDQYYDRDIPTDKSSYIEFRFEKLNDMTSYNYVDIFINGTWSVYPYVELQTHWGDFTFSAGKDIPITFFKNHTTDIVSDFRRYKFTGLYCNRNTVYKLRYEFDPSAKTMTLYYDNEKLFTATLPNAANKFNMLALNTGVLLDLIGFEQGYIT